MPLNRVEERLLLKCIRPPPEPPPHSNQVLKPFPSVNRTIQCAAGAEAVPHKIPLIATDGSSQVLHGTRRASWGVASSGNAIAHHMKGCDQNIYAAETFAILQVLLAAHSMCRTVRIICDSLAVVRTATAVRKGLFTSFLGIWHFGAPLAC